MPASIFDLPPEIRNAIYEHALVSTAGYIRPWHITSADDSSVRYSLDYMVVINGRHHRPTISLSLLRTCRQLYREAKNIFWSNNTFKFFTVEELGSFLGDIGKVTRGLITAVEFPLGDVWQRHIFGRMAGLAGHGSLKKVGLSVIFRDFDRFVTGKVSWDWREKILKLLKDQSKGALKGLERYFTIDSRRQWGMSERELVRDLHEAWGGRMIVNGMLEWDEGRHIGLFSGAGYESSSALVGQV